VRGKERRSFRSETDEERGGSYTFYVPVERTKRISGSANARVCRRRTTNGKERGEGKGEKGKRTVRWRVPVRLPRRETYGVLQSSASRASSTLGTDLRGENKRREPSMGIAVSNFVLLYALYGGMPYIMAVNRLVLPRIRTRS